MKYNRLTRRMFLQGTGGVLAIPFLESLVPKAYGQTVEIPPIRYVQMLNAYGVTPFGAFGDSSLGITAAIKANPSLLQTVSPNVRKALLSDFPVGDLSYTLGPEISNLRTKISVLRGFDVWSEDPDNRGFFHGYTLPTCAWGSQVNEYLNPPFPSVDGIMADSPKIYPAGFPYGRRLINLGPPGADTYYTNNSCSYRKTSNGIERVPLMQSTQALWDLFSVQGGVENSAVKAKLSLAMNKVYDDYAAVKNSTVISTSDKSRLSDYMDLISDINRGLTNTNSNNSCTLPTLGLDTNQDQQFANQTRILAAAMACGSTRVASMALHFAMPGLPDGHSIHHGLYHDPNDARWTNTKIFYDNVKLFSKRFASVVTLFDSINDKDGTSLLSNSILYWGSEFGTEWFWGQHTREDFPVIVAGGARGKLQHGNLIDYRKYPTNPEFDSHCGNFPLRGIPLNNLLVTFMNCMGLDYTDYETSDGSGYGFYPTKTEKLVGHHGSNVGVLAIPDEDYWFSKAGRRAPVPVLYKG